VDPNQSLSWSVRLVKTNSEFLSELMKRVRDARGLSLLFTEDARLSDAWD
jgi:hypothetical protein